MSIFSLYPNIQKGTILIRSIGSGHDSFYKVISRSQNFVRVQRLENKVVSRNIKCQSHDIVAGDKLDFDFKPILLKLSPDHIGPIKRLIWWDVWDGKKQNQFSS